MTTQIGTVKWFNPEMAYGFIATDEGQDVFVHRNAIADGRAYLVDGQGVEFIVRQGMKGLEADSVYVTQEATIPEHRSRALRGEGSGYGNGSHAYTDRPQHDRSVRQAHDVYDGPVPHGPVDATVLRLDPNGRFMFVRIMSLGVDVYVHNRLFAQLGIDLREGDTVVIEVEQSERGLRARSLERE